MGCDAREEKAATTRPVEAIPVRVASVSQGNVDQNVEVVGTLYGEEEAFISAKVGGRVLDIQADLGDRIASDAVLAQIDKTDYQFTLEQRQLALRESLAKLGLTEVPPKEFDVTQVATVQRASVQTENAKARLDRARQLYNQQPPLMSEQEFADIETQFRVYQQDYDVAVLDARSTLASAASLDAAVRIAQQQLDDTTVRAPRPANRDATWAVAERRVSIGELVQTGTTMYRVISDDIVKLRASVPELFASQIKQGQRVRLRVESSSAIAEGVVSRVSPAVDVSSRTFTIEATFDNAKQLLRPGSFARATVKVGERSDVTFIPTAGLYSFAGLDKVFTIKDGKAVEHRVVVVERTNDHVVIEGNLDGATEVVVSGLGRLANSVAVTLAPATTQTGAE